jgi:enamine deaminase RidA (YjgF/YER057c/UK114 family)
VVQQRKVNPWTWQDQYGFSQAIEVTAATRVVYCAGQTSTGPDAGTLHAGDMRGQALAALDNLEAVLREADMTLADVVRLNTYVTDVDRYLTEAAAAVGGRVAAAGVQPAATLLGVSRLAFPDLLVELEATAVA